MLRRPYGRVFAPAISAMRTIAMTATITLLAVLATSCVSKGRYDEAVSDAWSTRVELEKNQQALAKTNETITELYRERDERTRENAHLKLELWLQDRAAGADRRYASLRVAELAKRLTELERAQARLEVEAAFYRAVSERLAEQISAGDLDIVVRDGRMVLRLSDEVLFDSGRSELKASGRNTLAKVAVVLTSYPDRHFQVAGHTDDVPIKNDRFPSNWELSAARALGVLHFLVANGVAPEALSAAGYGSVDPLASNATPDGRKLNRRTEITVQPSFEDF
jgi:chemotaxis protein MotB